MQSVCSATIIQQRQACWFVLAGCSKWRRKAFWKPLTILWEEKVLPPSRLFSDRSFQTLFPTETLDGTFSGADGSQPLGWVRCFHWEGRCEIPLLEGSPVPRASAGGLCWAATVTSLSDTRLDVQVLFAHVPKRGVVQGRREFSQNQVSENLSRDPHPFEDKRNLPSDLVGPRIWLSFFLNKQ